MRPRRRAVPAAALALVLAGCAGASGTPVPGGSATPGSTPSPAASATDPAAPTAPPGGIVTPTAAVPPGGPGRAWSTVTSGPGYVTGVAHGPAGWLHVVLFDGEIPSVPRFRVSADLAAWTEARGDASGIVGGRDWAVAGTADAYVLAGGGVYRSADGATWVPGVAIPGSDAAALADVDGIAADGTRFLAWDSWASEGPWTSVDGRTWAPVVLPGAPALIVDAVAAAPGGGFAVAGRIGASVAELEAATADVVPFTVLPGEQGLWTSPDGTTWTRVPLGGGFGLGRITSLALGGPGGGLLAAGQLGPVGEQVERAPAVTLWRIRDGALPEVLAGAPFGLAETNPGETHVVALADRWLVLGARIAVPGPWPEPGPAGVVLGSDDGEAWWALEPDGEGAVPAGGLVRALATGEGRLVVASAAATPEMIGELVLRVSPAL